VNPAAPGRWVLVGLLAAALSCGERRAQHHIAALSDADSTLRRRAAHELVVLGRPAVPLLLEAAASGSDSLQYIVAQILGSIGDARAIPSLLSLSDSPNAFVRREAVLSLGRCGVGTPAAALVQRLASDGDAEVRGAAASALAALRDTSAVQPLVLALSDSAAAVRRSALASLHQLWTAASQEAALASLSDPDETVRFIAAQIIGKRQVAVGGDLLCRALRDTSVWVRAESARSLGLLGDPAAVESLVRLLKVCDSADCLAAREALLALTGTEYVLVP